MNAYFVGDNDDGNFHYNLEDANETEENITHQRTTPIKHAISNTALRVNAEQVNNRFILMPSIFASSIFMSCPARYFVIFMSCIFMPRDFDNPSFSHPAFSVNAAYAALDRCHLSVTFGQN